MIRFYDGYVDRLAADRGVWAFFKWLLLGIVLQILLMIPVLPLIVLGVSLGGDRGMNVGLAAFFAAFFCVRVWLFALPCKAVAERKGLGAPWLWGAGGLVLGQLVLGLAAALAPRSAE